MRSDVTFPGENDEPGAEVLPVLLHGLLQLLLSGELGDGVAGWTTVSVQDDADRLADHRLKKVKSENEPKSQRN